MIAVWKFELPIDDYVTILAIPRGARLLTVAVQDGRLVLYALVDTAYPNVMRRMRIAGTGHPISGDEAANYVGTVLMHGGRLVFHVFDLGEVSDVD